MLLLALLLSFAPSENGTLIVVVGAGGEEKYEAEFAQWATALVKIADSQNMKSIVVGQGETKSETSDRDELEKILKTESTEAGPLWIVLIGHGTFDGQSAKFNLHGPDVSAIELRDWLRDCARQLAIVNCASASGPFVNALSGKDRVIIAATKNGYEMNATRFGGYFVAALGQLSADLDKDQQVSLLEAFLSASNQVAEFYASDGRLATEHALIDDNGDGQGTPGDWFRGIRVAKQAKDTKRLPDGPLAHQWHLVPSDFEKSLPAEFRERRNKIELEIESLRAGKEQMTEEQYHAALEPLFSELAEMYETLEAEIKTEATDAGPVADEDKAGSR